MQINVKKTTKQGKQVKVLCGYDRPLDYVFMCIFDENEEELLYDNLALKNALKIKDFSFFENVAKLEFGIDLSEYTKKINEEMQKK
jgi:hypothetical protein